MVNSAHLPLKNRPNGIRVNFSVIVVLAIPLLCLVPRSTHDLPEVPVYVLVRRSSRDPALPQLSPHSQPPPHDAFTRRPGLPGLRLVGVLDSALLALRRMVAFDAAAACSSSGIHRLRECGRAGLLTGRMAFRRAATISCLVAEAICGCLCDARGAIKSICTIKGPQPKLEAF